MGHCHKSTEDFRLILRWSICKQVPTQSNREILGLIFKENLAKAKSSEVESSNTKSKKGNQHEPAKINPFILLEQGIEIFKAALETLSIEELKDVMAENGMDTAKLAMKWKDTNRLINHIIGTTQRRSSRGEIFWNIDTEKSTNLDL